MPDPRSTATTIDEYIAGFPAETQRVLQEMRELIAATAPGATETISYAMPTFDLNGRHLVHFAGYPHHIGFYPGASVVAGFKDKIKRYKWAKGSIQFPLDEPLPVRLIQQIVDVRVAANEAKVARKGR